MDFIINHSGFFLGIGITLLLALIGYYADKNDSKKEKKMKSSSKSNTFDELSNNNNSQIDESFPQNGKFINYSNSDLSTSDVLSSIPDGFAQVGSFDLPSDNNFSSIPDTVNMNSGNIDASIQNDGLSYTEMPVQNDVSSPIDIIEVDDDNSKNNNVLENY